MRRILLSSTAALALFAAGPAIAADMSVKAPPMQAPAAVVPTWSGTYIGINGGFGWATTNHTDLRGVSTGDFSQTGGLAGITYGGNWQAGQWVLGFESDLDWADINGTFSSPLCNASGGTTCFTKLQALSTERMRAGVDLNGWLLFATAGAAFGDVKAGQNPCGVVGFGNSCDDKWRAGWTAGAGIETRFAPRWSAKLEYLHFDLGKQFIYSPGVGVNVLERGDLVRVGINYQFDFLSLLNWH